MTTVSSTTSSSAATGSASSVSSATSAADQEDRFMKLLVAQMQNQDPLNPMDNSQMTSQIAQINTVGGIEKLNTTVTQLLSAFNNMQSQSALQLPGRDVLVEGSTLALQNGSAAGGVSLAADADTVKVDVLDPAGQVLRSISLGKSSAGVRSFTWDGKDSSGNAVADGNWQMRVTATANGKAVDATALTAAKVQSVTSKDGDTELDLGSLGSKAWSAIQSFL
ncbi:flagellar hook assembly protein FlgD [Ramlibacter sp. G-1-2-2]|uniref:Basal-body rod modification protein FlgD n=1 Tax=Ramlibacter agri TaxID=2728837 RepID=A0A848GXY2_9BURK|nr:flagellar hook assembly protein FlgD [Ramlibacter agri]NML43435.1 flagellar hook assembly protein FlgD [Ramlibacter agri]